MLLLFWNGAGGEPPAPSTSAEASTDNLFWYIYIDWDGDGALGASSDTNEADYCIGMSVQRGRDYLIKSDGKGFEPQKVGECRLTLVNDDGRYDPFNAAGANYPNVRTGRYAKVYVTDGYEGTQYNILAGRVTDIQLYRRGARRFANVTIKDGWQWLTDYDAFEPLSEDVTVGAALDEILDGVSWPTVWGSTIDTAGGDNIGYWWEDKQSAESVIHDLAYNYEMGTCYIANDGKFAFRRRSYSDTDVIELTQSLILKDIGTPMPWETVRNVARVVVNPRLETTNTVLWTMGGQPTIEAGGTLETFADFRYENREVPAKNLITPLPTTDYTAVKASGGVATTDDATSDLSCSIDYEFGLSAKLTWTNSDTDTAIIITHAQLRGDAIDCPYQTTMEDATQLGTDQPRILSIDTQYMQDINQGEGAVLHLARWLSPIQEYPVVYIEQRPSYQFLPDLQDKIGLSVAVLGIDDSYRVGAIEHEWLSETGQAVRTCFRLEPLPDMTGLWQFEAQFASATSDCDAGYTPTIFGY